MDMNFKNAGNELTVELAGRLDTSTSPDLEKELSTRLDGIQSLIYDFKDLDYISSAGLRVVLATQKTMNKNGSMKLINVNESIMEILEVTGMVDILTIE
ncbi:MAG: STAS domain-containing protein [Lachnospiraceae bacterium]|nr:STAS domain-containing protein [Lachnospiraceae bacterium]